MSADPTVIFDAAQKSLHRFRIKDLGFTFHIEEDVMPKGESAWQLVNAMNVPKQAFNGFVKPESAMKVVAPLEE